MRKKFNGRATTWLMRKKFNGQADVKLQLGSEQFPANILVAEGLSVDLILGRRNISVL